MEYNLTNAVKDAPRQTTVNKNRLVFIVSVISSWVFLLLPLFPLFTYTSPNTAVWQRYSTQYPGGLLIYITILLLWLLLLGLPELYIRRLSRSLESLKSNRWLHRQFICTCVFLTLLALTTMPLWGWGYNRLLWLDILMLGGWVSCLPTFWEWGQKGWPIRPVSLSRLYYWLTHNPHLWLPLLIGVGVLLASNVLGFSASPRNLMLILGLLPAIGVVLLFIHWPALGLVALIGSIIIPINGPSGSNATMALVALLLCLWLLDMIVHQREIKLPPSGTIRPLLILVLVAILAFGVGQLPWYTFAQAAPLGAQLGGLAVFVLSAGAFLLVAYYVRDLCWLEWLTWLFLTLGGLYIAGRLAPGLGQFTNSLFESATGSLFWTWLVALSFSQAVFNRNLHLGWRVGVGGLTLATLYVALTQGWAWNSGWIPPLVAIMVILWAAQPKLGLLFAFMGAIGAVTKLQKLIGLIMVGDNEYSLGTRLDAWAIVWEISKVNPILGLGPANYYWYTPLFPIRGYAVRFNSHSQYVDLIAQTGFLGLACFLWFFGATGWLGWQLRQRVPAGFAQAYVYGALGGLAGTLAAGALGDWVLPFFYNIGLAGFRASMLGWLFLGGLVALEQMYMSQRASASVN